MGVLTLYGKGYKDPAANNPAEAVFAEGRVRAINSGAVSVASGASIASKVYFGKIASNAVPLCGLSTLKFGALTSVTDFDIGLEKDGATISANLFTDGLDIHAAGAADPLANVALANWGKRVWELLGLATDPGCEYDIVGTLNVAATATASVALLLLYAKR